MTNTERIINFCVDYFNKHDLEDDEPITADDIYIISYLEEDYNDWLSRYVVGGWERESNDD